MKNSKLGKLSLKDLMKGGITAVMTAVVAGLYAIINNGGIPTTNDLKIIGTTGLLAFGGYILKNLGTNSEDKFLGGEKPKE